MYLRDVATAEDSIQDERLNMRFWVRGHDVPVGDRRDRGVPPGRIQRRRGRQSVRVCFRRSSRSFRRRCTIRPIYDQSTSIVNSVPDVKETLYIAFFLVVLVIFLFLGRAKDTLIPAVALPLSLLLTFIAMNALGYSLDNLSLMALTLAIGFLVDDAIVFLENTVRRMDSRRDGR